LSFLVAVAAPPYHFQCIALHLFIDNGDGRIFLSFALTGPRQIFCLPMLWNTFYKQYHRVLSDCLAAEGNPTDPARIEVFFIPCPSVLDN
jgi:hypothetical protein